MNAYEKSYRDRLELIPRGKEFLLLDRHHDGRHLLRHRRVRRHGRLSILLDLLTQTPTVAHLAGKEAREGLVVLEEQRDLVQDLVQRRQLRVLHARLVQDVLLEDAFGVGDHRFEVTDSVVVSQNEIALHVRNRVEIGLGGHRRRRGSDRGSRRRSVRW